MANRNNSHAGKSPQHRANYGRYIKSMDYEPTIEESLDFGATEDGGEDLSEPTTLRRVRGRNKYLLREHFKDHWLEWIVAGALIVALFLINESRVTTAIMSKDIESSKDQLNELSDDFESFNGRLYNLELKSEINRREIDNLIRTSRD